MNAKILAFVIYFIYFVLAFIEAIIYLLLHNLHDCIFVLLLRSLMRSICTPMEHPIISQNMTLSKYICEGNRNHDSIFFTFELSNLKMF